MAGDWIKMRTDLYRDPKVCVIADILSDPDGALASFVSQNCQRDMTVTRNVMRNVTVGALVAVWGIARVTGKRQGDDLHLRGATVSVVDDVSELPGFGDAMQQVGWLVENSKGLIFPRFFADYNVDPMQAAKEKNAERQRRYRNKSNVTSDVTNNVTRNVTVTDREEKRREETKTPLTPQGGEVGSFDPVDQPPTPSADRVRVTWPQFWELFPRKERERVAKQHWTTLVATTGMPDSLLTEILDAVRAWLPIWATRLPDKVPTPASWIEEKRWTEKPPATRPAKSDSAPLYKWAEIPPEAYQ